METTFTVDLGRRSYPIHVGTDLLGQLGERLGARVSGRLALVVTDDNVGPLYGQQVQAALDGAGFRPVMVTVPAGEATKCLRVASQLIDRLVSEQADRRSVVLGLGGGVVGDLAGFVAATYARGIAFAQVPTTLLAMVDASVGGKVAVDHPRAKNMIGAFHQPVMVTCDLNTLQTLSLREYRCGVAEAVKHGVILDEELFDYMQSHAAALADRHAEAVRHIVAESCRIKADVVAKDEQELSGLRAKLNYGHTFAHALETADGYGGIHHGEAVAIGMICAAHLAERLGMVATGVNERQRSLWELLGLPTRIPAHLLAADLVAIMRRDKKARAGRLRLILPTRLGNVEMVEDVDEDLVRQVLKEVNDL